MKKRLLLFVLLLNSFLFYCQEKNNDTIFIKNEKHHKIYIEKNRNSDWYKYIAEFRDFNTEFSSEKIIQFGLKSRWMRIYKYQGEYFLYAPCDWMYDTKIIMNDTKFQIQNSETVIFDIKSIKKSTDNIFIKCKNPSNKEKTLLKIHPVDKNLGIYEFIFSDKFETYKYLMLDADNYLNYDIIVNYCTDSKTNEFF